MAVDGARDVLCGLCWVKARWERRKLGAVREGGVEMDKATTARQVSWKWKETRRCFAVPYGITWTGLWVSSLSNH